MHAIAASIERQPFDIGHRSGELVELGTFLWINLPSVGFG
jgi:hypothetical protein